MSADTVCIPNIGPLERRRRMRFGVVFLAIGVAIGVCLLATDASRAWRALAFVPLWLGALGVVQAKEKTCVALVKRGERNMDHGAERVTDETTLRQLDVQARRVHAKSFGLAALLTAALVAIP